MTTLNLFAGVVIVAAGRGERFGNSDKVLAEAAGRPLLCWSVAAALAASVVSEIVVVAGAHNREAIEDALRTGFPAQSIAVCTGGPRRQDSVMAGLSALKTSPEIAVIHDAARPLATAAMFDAAALAAEVHGAAITAVPVTDTIKEVEGSMVVRTIDRTSLQAAQTPQAYRRSLLEQAFSRTQAPGMQFTDEAELLESLGHAVAIIEGARSNLKVTIPEDLAMIDFLLTKRSGGA